MRYHSFLSKEDSSWGEKQVVRFRWILVFAVMVLIGYIFIAGETLRGFYSLALASLYIFYNLINNLLLKKFDNAVWIRYVSSTVDVTILAAHIYNYSCLFKPIAVATAPSLFIFAILIMLSVLRYDGKLVIYTTAYVVLCTNIIYFVRYPDIDPEVIKQVASGGPEGVLYRSVYFILMGYFMFSIPKMINRLVEKQNRVNNERREIEIKLALESQKRELAIQNLALEQQLSEELNNQKVIIEQQNQKLERLVATKDKLFSIIGHDLRSPFCVQSSLTEYLIHDFNEIDKEALLDNIYAINKTANNGLNMLSNLIDWSKSQNDLLNPRPENINVLKKIKHVIDQQSESVIAKKIDLQINVASNCYTYADDQMIETVLRNLLSNAIKFTLPEGTIAFSAFYKDEDCHIQIKDSGVGIKDEIISKLFMPEHYISSTGTNNEKGTGLGLILCKEMIDKNNGKLQVESIPERGTTFTIVLPMKANV